uniref:Uncharacterized protein n=1 Tax=Triticum urartu TaxID=4572 RepID=A0A8R7QR81_TRIUA
MLLNRGWGRRSVAGGDGLLIDCGGADESRGRGQPVGRADRPLQVAGGRGRGGLTGGGGGRGRSNPQQNATWLVS